MRERHGIWKRLGSAAALALLVTASSADAHRAREDKTLMKCQKQITEEGLYFSARLNSKMARCLLPLAECSIANPGRPQACDRAARSCRSLPGDVAGLEGRLISRVVSACRDLSMANLLGGLQFNAAMAGCNPTTVQQFAACLADNLSEAEAQGMLHMEPAACGLIQQAGISEVFPATMCAPEDEDCEDPPPPPPPPTCEGDLFCGGADAVACPEGFMCNLQDALCGANVGGVCVPAPASCESGSPVCGCDGQTYASDCERLMAGATLGHVGQCAAACFSSGDCAEGEFCELPTGDCGESQPGVCRAMQDAGCSTCGEYAAGMVCGCDGLTYTSECARMAAGAAKLGDGSCF